MKFLYTKKKNNTMYPSIHKENDENHILTLKDWNWKLEQSLNQLRSRINAVENRLSVSSHQIIPNEKTDYATVNNKNDFMNVGEHQNPLSDIISQYEKTLTQIEHDYKEIQTQIDHILLKQKSSSLTMHVKGKEIPLEITGIIGGILVFLIAILIGIGGKSFVLSPSFLSLIGCILIGSTLFRSFNGVEWIRSYFENKRPFKKS